MTEQKKDVGKEEKQEQKQLPDKKITKPEKEKKTTGNKLFYVVSFIILLVIVVISVLVNQQLKTLQQNIENSGAQNERLISQLDDRIKGTSSRFSVINQKLDELESSQQVLSHNLSQPQQQQDIQVNEDFALSEIEHLLIIASYKLQLEQNVLAALAAMETADTRLKALNDPAVLSVREQLIVDMNELRSLNQADLSGLGLYLSDLINRVDELPIKDSVLIEPIDVKAGQDAVPVTGVKAFFTLVWEELKGLIIITRDTEVSKARLLPDEIYFLRANLRLELANARFAVFGRDTENLHASINQIQLWLQEYFDMSDTSVNNIYEALDRMNKLDLAFPELDISSSLESVRALIKKMASQLEDTNEYDLEQLQ